MHYFYKRKKYSPIVIPAELKISKELAQELYQKSISLVSLAELMRLLKLQFLRDQKRLIELLIEKKVNLYTTSKLNDTIYIDYADFLKKIVIRREPEK